MEKVFNKWGIYDVLGVWLAGVMISMLSTVTYSWVYPCSGITIEYLKNPIILIAGGYFVGMVFQELGNFIQRRVFNKNRLYLKNILDEKYCKDKSNTSLTKDEIRGIKNLKYFKTITIEKGHISSKSEIHVRYKNYEFIYNFCKNRVSQGDMSGVDRNQAVAATARSLAVYFAMVTIASFVLACNYMRLCCSQICCRLLFIFIISALLSVIFFYRSNRFIKLRYIQYLRAFYYTEIDPKL